MLRLHWALLAALLLAAGSLTWLGYSSAWRAGDFCEELGTTALSWRLMGLAGLCFSQAIDGYRADLAAAEEAGDDVWQQAAKANVVRMRTELARLLLAVGRTDAALGIAEQAHRTDYDNPAATALLWQIRHAAGEQSRARRELLLLGMVAPTPETLVALGEVSLADGRLDDAVYYADRAREQAAESPELWYLLARIHLTEPERSGEAHEAAARAAELAAANHLLRHQSRNLCLDIEVAKAQNAGQTAAAVWIVVREWVSTHWVFIAVSAAYIIVLLSPALIGPLWRRGEKRADGGASEVEDGAAERTDTQ